MFSPGGEPEELVPLDNEEMGRGAMAMAATTLGALPEAEHSAQLRKAVIASTIGTAIEWYDFFLYGTAAGLVFGKLFFPNEDAAVGDAARLRHLFHRLRRPPHRRCDFRPLRRSHRPQGDADRDAAVHGAGDLRHRLCADLLFDRHLGRRPLDRAAHDPRHRRRRRMGRVGALGDGVVAHAQPARSGCRLGRNSACPAVCCCPTSRCWSSARMRATIS